MAKLPFDLFARCPLPSWGSPTYKMVSMLSALNVWTKMNNIFEKSIKSFYTAP